MGSLTRRGSEDTRQDGSNHSAYAMQFEHIHTLIDVEPVIHILHESANDGCQEADNCSQPDAHVTCCRGDANKTGNCTFAGTDNAKTALMPDVVDEDLAGVSISNQALCVPGYY